MKVKCPDCRQSFEIDENEYDEGDYLSCPECNLELTVEVNEAGKIRIRASKERDLDSEEFDDFFDE